MVNKLEIAKNKLTEYIDGHKALLDLDYKKGRQELSNLQNRVYLWADRVYGDRGNKQLEKVGYIKNFGFINFSGQENPQLEQKEYLADIHDKIEALKALNEDLDTWGEPDKISLEEETKSKIDLKLIKREKSTKKKII